MVVGNKWVLLIISTSLWPILLYMYMLFDFEPPATYTPTKHDAATAKELHTPVKLITFSIVDMATSPFAHPSRLCPWPNNNHTQEPQIRDKGASLAQTCRVKLNEVVR